MQKPTQTLSNKNDNYQSFNRLTKNYKVSCYLLLLFFVVVVAVLRVVVVVVVVVIVIVIAVLTAVVEVLDTFYTILKDVLKDSYL